jgi:cytoskeletal protein RodZ
MPEIGSTLREARMRARIDITEVEQATKIRAKYLRALENEEWNLLPGSTFIKSFLREYADYLGLDARMLVEEYKLRYERPSEHELAPISPNLGRDRGRGPAGPRVPPQWAVVGALLLVLLVALWALGSLGGDDDGGDGASGDRARTTSTRTTGTGTTSGRTTEQPSTPTRARVRLAATDALYVCLVDQDGKVLIPGSTLSAGQRTREFRARSMRLTLGNNNVELTVNGRRVTVPASAVAIGYRLTPEGASPLAAAQAPTCT